MFQQYSTNTLIQTNYPQSVITPCGFRHQPSEFHPRGRPGWFAEQPVGSRLLHRLNWTSSLSDATSKCLLSDLDVVSLTIDLNVLCLSEFCASLDKRGRSRGKESAGRESSELAELQAVKKGRDELELRLRRQEQYIYDLETNYLETTALTGNVVRGWQGFANKSKQGGGAAGAASSSRKKSGNSVKRAQRIFSLSSATSPINETTEPSDTEVAFAAVGAGLSAAMASASGAAGATAAPSHHAVDSDDAAHVQPPKKKKKVAVGPAATPRKAR
ncbi:Chromatin modification-related protein MEAF6 [Porphyridium purpureum]|uniref:Chromatin modification-related protein MEAF6 n=1 Tax=Porphyridium purpureum TaxID=35688 RepID=A0A5J4YRY5_PORPP|nr:Chromatin modification-related protein MEAF6 [Porphyridium purpureum]|eukprot:POR2401..scf229_5